MLRAISEIAVASSVWSVLGMSRPIASARARWRAVTTSASDSIAIRSGRVTSAKVTLACSSASPSSRSSAVCTSSKLMPSWTIANATSGWMPTITVSAPRRRVIIAIPRSERETNESMTSSDVTSTMIPRERWRVTCAITSSRSCRTSVSVSADWIEAIRNGPCLRIGTAI